MEMGEMRYEYQVVILGITYFFLGIGLIILMVWDTYYV